MPVDFFRTYHAVGLLLEMCTCYLFWVLWMVFWSHFSLRSWGFSLEEEELFVLAKEHLISLSRLQIVRVWPKCANVSWAVSLSWIGAGSQSSQEGVWEGSVWKHWPFSFTFIRQNVLLLELGHLFGDGWCRGRPVPKCICTRGQS